MLPTLQFAVIFDLFWVHCEVLNQSVKVAAAECIDLSEH